MNFGRLFSMALVVMSLSFIMAECPGGEDVCLSLNGSSLNYDSSGDIYGFQFNHDGCALGASGGDAVANGFTVTEIAVNHRAREFGESKYGGSRMIRGFFDFLSVAFVTKYAKRPLHLFGSIGSALFLVGTAINIYFIIIWFGGFVDKPGINPLERPLFFLGILLLIVGIQIFSMGFIAELVVNFLSNANKSVKRIIKSED